MSPAADRKQRERELARGLVKTADRQERLRVWQAKTGKCQASLYRRLIELESHEGRTSE